MNPLSFTIPDAPVIDALRGFVVVAGVLLFIGAPTAWWKMRQHVPRRIRKLLIVLVGADVYITATEAQQIGHRMLVWRLPLGFCIIVGSIAYLAQLSVAVSDQTPVR